MIKEALQFITGLKEASMEPRVVTIDGKTYCNKDLKRYDTKPLADPIQASTLTALLGYIWNKNDEMKESMILHVISPTKVKLYSGLDQERRREELFCVTASVPNYRYDEWYDQERFLIEAQADFEMKGGLPAILKVAGNVEAKTTANYGDDGISQKTTIKQGIASKTDVVVPNPVTLFPYRTFLEVEQPESQFVFRIKDSDGRPLFKLVEAEGGLWKNQAMRQISEYLEEALEECPVCDRITIIA